MRVTLLAIAIFTLFSCKNKKENASKSLGVKEIVGRWVGECQSDRDDDFRVSIEFLADGKFSRERTTFIEPDCRVEGHQVSRIGRYELLERAEGRLSLKMLPSSVSITPLHDDVASIFNEIIFCSSESWVTGESKEFHSELCAATQQPEIIELQFDEVDTKIEIKSRSGDDQFYSGLFRRG